MILGVFVLVVIALVLTVVTSLVYGGALLFVVGALSSLIGRSNEPSPPRYLSRLPALQVTEQQTNSALLTTTEEIGQVYVEGESSGLRLTVQSDNQLFDRRFPEAQLLNQELLRLYSIAQQQSSVINDLREEQARLVAEWELAHGSWQRNMAFLHGVRFAAIAYVPATLTVAVIPRGVGSQISAEIARLVWFDAPQLKPYYMALAGGTVVSAVTALLSGYSLRSDLAAGGRLESSTWLREQAAASSAENESQREQAEAAERVRAERFRRDREGANKQRQRQSSKVPSQAAEKTWYEILEVSRSATRQEISAAWRTKVLAYHPDLTGKLAPEFKELAEARTKEINRAKDEGLAQVER